MPPVSGFGVPGGGSNRRKYKHPSTYAHCKVCYDALLTTSWEVPRDERPYTRREIALYQKSVRFLLAKAETQVRNHTRCGSCRLILEVARHFNSELNSVSSLSNVEVHLRQQGVSSFCLSLKLLSSKDFVRDRKFASVDISSSSNGKAGFQSTVALHRG